MRSIECTLRKIRSVVSASPVPEDPLHAEDTLQWLLRLKPDADMALQIAALGHDIERALEDRKVQRSLFRGYNEFKAAHALNSAELLKGIMQECGVDRETMEDVYDLVCMHETGGDPRSDLLNQADSLSFFHVNLPYYYERNGYMETLRRCLWGYQRLPEALREQVKRFTYRNKRIADLMKELTKDTEPSFQIA